MGIRCVGTLRCRKDVDGTWVQKTFCTSWVLLVVALPGEEWKFQDGLTPPPPHEAVDVRIASWSSTDYGSVESEYRVG